MTSDELAKIKKRLAWTDIPALVAEVERLQVALAEERAHADQLAEALREAWRVASDARLPTGYPRVSERLVVEAALAAHEKRRKDK